jgi:predicted metal-dependent enzyme (double-stranded beta helix superfamily)
MEALAPSTGAIRPEEVALLPRPRDRDLSRAELRAFVIALADRPELWIRLVSHDPDQRRYAELISDEHLTAWLICWMDDHDTGFHDHDLSAGAVAVVGGRVREERLRLEAPACTRLFAPGEAFDFSPSDIHRVCHCGSDPAVTLHVYSPPLHRMGAYFIDERGVLARLPQTASQELRPFQGSTPA